MPVNTQKSWIRTAIAGEIHRQILIRGDPGDEEMTLSGYKRSPECLRGAQGDLNLNYKCLWLMAWEVSCPGTHYPVWAQRLLRAIADAATQT